MSTKRNWPDLRRDCDCLESCIVGNFSKETDLIYEGIATRRALSVVSLAGRQRNWPDLRRDCDLLHLEPKPDNAQPQRNWPDLRRDCDHPSEHQLEQDIHKETDLIYEGIATQCPHTDRQRRFSWKKLTWFTKGLRLSSSYFVNLDRTCCPKKLTWFTKGLRPR